MFILVVTKSNLINVQVVTLSWFTLSWDHISPYIPGGGTVLYEFVDYSIYQHLKRVLISLSFNKQMSKNSAY